MKKFLAKLVLFGIIGVLLNLMNVGVYAEETLPEEETSLPADFCESGTHYDEEKGSCVEDRKPKPKPFGDGSDIEEPATPTPRVKEPPSEDDIQRKEDLIGDLAALKSAENRCYEPSDAYNITIIEEPLLWEEQMGEGNDKFKTQICYRNTVMYSYAKQRETMSEYSKVCSDELRDRADKETEAVKKGDKKTAEIVYSCEEVMVIFSSGGTSLIEGYISIIYKWGAGMAGIIAVLVIVISGIQISASGGDSQAIEGAKNRIIKSLAGIAVLFLSGLLLYTINPTFFN